MDASQTRFFFLYHFPILISKPQTHSKQIVKRKPSILMRQWIYCSVEGGHSKPAILPLSPVKQLLLSNQFVTADGPQSLRKDIPKS